MGRRQTRPACASMKAGANVEYFRDVRPIFERSCAALSFARTRPSRRATSCWTMSRPSPRRTATAACSPAPQRQGSRHLCPPGLGHRRPLSKSLKGGWAIRRCRAYVRRSSRARSLLAWKLFGERMDGWSNDDFPHRHDPRRPEHVAIGANRSTPPTRQLRPCRRRLTGSLMPPPEAVASGKSSRSATRTASRSFAGSTSVARSTSISIRPAGASPPAAGWIGRGKRDPTVR